MKSIARAGKTLICLSVVIVAQAAWAVGYVQLQRIWATEPERIEAAVRTYPEAFRDGFILSAFPETLKSGTAEVKDFAVQSRFVSRFQKLGLPVQICISSTIGHNDGWTLPGDYPMMVGVNGRRAKAMACPRSDRFKAHIRERFSRYAALHPTVIWFDDDFRMNHHSPADFACVCDECMAKFNAKFGLNFNRDSLVKAILSDASVGKVNVRDAFSSFSTEALNDIVRVAADAVHAVDGDIALGFMAVNMGGTMFGERDFAAWCRMGRNRKGEVWFRPGSGAYDDVSPLSSNGIIEKNIKIGRLVAATDENGAVNVSEEVTLPYNRMAKSMCMTFLECALNVGLAGCNGSSFDAIKPNLAEQLGKGAVVDMLNRRRHELERMYALVAGKRQIGVAVPPPEMKRGPVKSFAELIGGKDSGLREKLFAGIPFAFRPQYACQTLENFDRKKLPARIDAFTRVGISLWEATNGFERIAFVWNFGYDRLSDAKLVLDSAACVECLDPNGVWSAVGRGTEMTLPAIDAWSVGLLRIRGLDFKCQIGYDPLVR